MTTRCFVREGKGSSGVPRHRHFQHLELRPRKRTCKRALRKIGPKDSLDASTKRRLIREGICWFMLAWPEGAN